MLAYCWFQWSVENSTFQIQNQGRQVIHFVHVIKNSFVHKENNIPNICIRMYIVIMVCNLPQAFALIPHNGRQTIKSPQYKIQAHLGNGEPHTKTSYAIYLFYFNTSIQVYYWFMCNQLLNPSFARVCIGYRNKE